MKRIVFAVRDRQALTFGAPFVDVTLGAAVRSFTDAINRPDKDSNLYMHPDDFDLYECGFFDDQTGLFDCHVPEQICVGKNVATGRS